MFFASKRVHLQLLTHKIMHKPLTAAARYVKAFAKNLGEIPAWHPGAGSPAFIFIDEITVE